jgi:hypothetical protein
MEEAMLRYIAIGTLAIFAVALTLSGPAEARGGARAPTKFSPAQQDANQNQQATRNNFPITEYSSSSARHRSH